MKILISFFFLTFLAFVQAQKCNCRIKTENRIINGEISSKNSLPWIVSLASRDYNLDFCGGSILNEKYILTAANCIFDKVAENIKVKAGINSLEDRIIEQVYHVKKIYSREFKGPQQPGDIAILELEEKIKFIEGVVEKGCFNLERRDYSEPLLAAGWGLKKQPYHNQKTNEKGTYFLSDKLSQAFFTQNEKCQDFSICLKPNEKKQSVCIGDSGTPLHYTENGITKIEGVGSYTGSELKSDTLYYCNGNSFYSRLSYYADWISEIADFKFCGSGPKTKPMFKEPKKKTFGFF